MRTTGSAAIRDHIAALLPAEGWVAAYVAIGGEPSIHEAVPVGRILLPRTTAAGLVFHRWDGSSFVRGQMGVPEPDAALPVVAPADIALWLVPGVVFDRDGNRLGYGKGHYDRALVDVPGRKIGVAWAMQVVERVPAEAHDVPMDGMVTEEGAWVCR